MPLNPPSIKEFEKTRKPKDPVKPVEVTRIRHKAPAHKKMAEYKKRDDITKTVFDMSPDEVDKWLVDNVKNLKDVRMMMKRIIMLIQS